MDCGASFKYMVAHLSDRFHLIAPDLRGFGETEHCASGYWFPDYFADLSVILDYFAPDTAVDLLGHSMGGNISLLYAGINPTRVGRVLSLEGIGMPPSKPSDALNKYQQWMQQILSNEPSKIYPSADMLKHSIYKGNPSLPDAIIEDLAELWGKPVGEGGAVMLKHDHKHRYVNPVRYSVEDTQEIWRSVQAKVGLVMAAESRIYKQFGINAGRVDEAKEALRIAPENYYLIENCNHMLHLEQPQKTAASVLDFFGE